MPRSPRYDFFIVEILCVSVLCNVLNWFSNLGVFDLFRDFSSSHLFARFANMCVWSFALQFYERVVYSAQDSLLTWSREGSREFNV